MLNYLTELWGDTSDVVSKEMYTFQDKKGRYISLRPEGTSGIARAYVENKMYGLPENYKKFIIWDQCLDMKDLKMVDKDNSTNLG